MIKKILLFMVVLTITTTCLFACSNEEKTDKKENKSESNGEQTDEEKLKDADWTEVAFKDLFSESALVDGEKVSVYYLGVKLDNEEIMYSISKEQYEALWYYCYSLTTDSDNDFHLYITYDEPKDADSTEKGTVTNYKVINNDEVVTINGNLDDAKEYLIKEHELFEVGEGDYLLSISFTSYDDPNGENPCIIYTGHWREDDGTVDMETLKDRKAVVASVLVYKNDNEELFNELMKNEGKDIDFIRCKAKCDVSVKRIFGNPVNEFEIIEIIETIE